MAEDELESYLSGPPHNDHPELHQFPDWGERGHPYAQPMPCLAPDAGEQLIKQEPCTMLVPQALLDDYAGFSDILNDVFTGKVKLKPLPPPKRHRCLACWLISLLPGHDRCDHDYLIPECDCYDC